MTPEQIKTNQAEFGAELQIGYRIDDAYRNADRYTYQSDNWHRWMDEAKRLENKLHKRS